MFRILLLASLVACSLGAATRRRPRLDGRIVGGQAVNIEDFPYQLSYEYGGSHMCGGSIISTNWVVTAGHCVDGSSVYSSRFRAGSSIRGSGGSIHDAQQLILNPLYDYYLTDFDIAVARVSVPFTYGTGVQPISLTSTEPAAGALTVVSGWGTLTSGSSSLPSQLQAVELSIISRSECNSAYIDYGGITENMICAAVDGGGKDSCQGAATRRRPRLDGRIVGGHAVSIEDFPYQLSYENGGSHICGGSIISTNWVVTAGHCVDGSSVSSSQFRAGSSIRGSGGTVHPAVQLILNPLYDYYTIDFDIAVARVSVPFTYGSGVQPIPLTSTEPAAGALAVVSGWGYLNSSDSTYPLQLHAVELYIISSSECNSAYDDYGGITTNMICAAVNGGGKDACEGDSGGPLVVNGILVGIVSWGIGCGQPGFPGVYTDVAALRSFVTDQTGV